jgi:superoxide dismutase, Fe-Mn family
MDGAGTLKGVNAQENFTYKRYNERRTMITLPKLPYAYDALEPYIDARTMEIHYTKHHQAYVDKLNAVLTKYPLLDAMPVEELLAKLSSLAMDEKDRTALKNSGGGHVNHAFFWTVMGPKKTPDKNLVDRISQKFGSIDAFKKLFTEVAVGHFGSGWAWLVENKKKELEIYSTPNQDSPYLVGHTPIIALDLWEHAYYLKYQNRRAEYVANWWSVLKLLP